MNAPRICLSMIVRNEAAIIDRCLQSALPLIDAAVICDTGSTDDTPRLCRERLGAANIPAAVLHHEWQDFGSNRTRALHAAGEFVSGLSWSLDTTYWLLLDADLELLIEPSFDRDSLRSCAYVVPHSGDALDYWTLRLARASLNWRASGLTHETYECEGTASWQRLSTLRVRDHGDGGSKRNKYQRDIQWLTADLGTRPDDPRTLFYLAQTYEALGDGIRALVLYYRVLTNAASTEEQWYAKVAIGRLHATGDVGRAEAAFLEAFDMDPTRAEPLYELACLYRQLGRFGEAAAQAARGRLIPLPTERNLPTRRAVYEHLLDLELARAAAQTTFHDQGFAACERLILGKMTPPNVLDEAKRAMLSYLKPLKGAAFLPLEPESAPGYRACNPSLVASGTGYTAVCRTVNYEQRRLHYRSNDADGVFRSANVVLELDRDFAVLRQHPMTIDTEPLRHAGVQGFEDCRLVKLGDRLLATCTTADRHPSGRVHMSLLEIAPTGRVRWERPLMGCFDDRTQKNWLPFAGSDGSLLAVYGYDPLTIVRIEPDTGCYSVDRVIEHSVTTAGWRGSAGPIAWGSGRRRLIVIHEPVHRAGPDGIWERVYWHRFIEVDPTFRLTRISGPFVFAHHGVEFVCGMTHGGNADVLLGLGVEDSRAYICRMDTARIEALLECGEVIR